MTLQAVARFARIEADIVFNATLNLSNGGAPFAQVAERLCWRPMPGNTT